MTGFVVERHGYANASLMTADIITDLIANGFTLQFQTFSSNGWNAANVTGMDPTAPFVPYRVIVEAGPTVDPLNVTPTPQPWRVCFDVQALETVFVYVATPTQLPNTGVVAVMTMLASWTSGNGDRTVSNKQLVPYDVVGVIGAAMSDGTRPSTSGSSGSSSPGHENKAQIDAFGTFTPTSYIQGTGDQGGTVGGDADYLDDPTKGFVNRSRRVTTLGSAYPLSYRMVISPRGIWLGCWEDASTQETAASFNWFLIQRPVDRTTGTVLTTGKAPVFCVNGIGGLYWQFVVRENDILKPGKRRQADADSEDSETILNSGNQVSLSEDGKYIVTFPSRLNTSRYRYPHELDMIGTTSADVVSQYTSVPLTVYGEAQPRTYLALQSTGASSTGMRLLVLQQGGGIS